MNCQLCLEKSEAYRNGSLRGDIRSQVENHLKGCIKCTEIYRLITLAEKVIAEEKALKSNPFLVTRIMAQIENMENPVKRPIPAFTRIMKPALITLSLAAAIFFGFAIGNIAVYSPENNALPAELTLIDDATIESVFLLSNE